MVGNEDILEGKLSGLALDSTVEGTATETPEDPVSDAHEGLY